MKWLYLLILLLLSNVSYSQKEANIWYFGENAGLDFNSGSPVALLNGQLNTLEGCSTISDANGNLLFYSDGVTVWNRNHGVMLNGTGLNGHESSTHSALVVPKPNDANVYYIFTVDQGFIGANGIQYSEVDLTLDGGLGGITLNKNILLHTPTTEKLTAVKNSSGTGFWVLSHKLNSNEFIAYEITASGVNTTPIISAAGTVITDAQDSIGQIKISPNGSKVAAARRGGLDEVQLFDFNPTTGAVSNPLTILPNVNAVYGVEFSPSSNVLYVSGYGGRVYQYDLNAGSSADIINSEFLIQIDNSMNYSAIQLGPDSKLYITKIAGYLDVIENPDVVGLGCNYITDAVFLEGRTGQLGLPPFIQSFFRIDDIEFQNVCFGESTSFNLVDLVDSATWNFDDLASGTNNTSTDLAPTHVFSAPGTYEVSVNVTIDAETASSTITVIIYEQPTTTQPQDILICDDDNDGFYSFDLTQNESSILNGQSTSIFDVTYYTSMTDYMNDNPITDPGNYTNTTTYTSQTIIASVKNINNADCEATTTFNIQVFESPTPVNDIPSLSFCDNTSLGTDVDGIIEFDLTQNEATILNGQSAIDFTVSYFTDSALTNQINTPSAYQNTNPTETIYVQVVNNNYSNCVEQTSFSIEVFELPTVAAIVNLRQCDDDLDGFSIFNLTEVNAEISTNHLNETISFYETQSDAESGNNPITNTTTYTNQTVSIDMVWARLENLNNCYITSQVNLVVSTTQIPNTYTRDFYQCDHGPDTTDGIATFDLGLVNTEIQGLFPVGQQLIINYYRNQADALSEINPITNITNYQNIGYPNQQDVFIRVDSALDNDCLGLGHHITLHVETVPIAHSVVVSEQCDDDGDSIYAFDTSNIETTLLNGQTNVIIAYFDGLGNPLPSPLPNPFSTATQTITARVTNATSLDLDGACFDETQIMFTVGSAVVAYAVSDFIECDDDNDGQFAFDTSNVEASVLNGQTGMIVTYIDESGNLLPSPLPNPFITDTQTMTARVENQLSAICYDETTINFIVSEQPTANPIANDFVCDDIGNDGEHIFLLSYYDSQILNGQSQSKFEVFYFENNMDAQNNMNPLSNSYIVSSSSQTIFAKIQNVNNPDCFEITTFELGVHYLPIANQPEDILVCDDETNDGIEAFDLSVQNSIILNGQSDMDNTITYHLTLTNAENNTNTISENYTNTENPQTIYVRLENNDYSDCYTTTSFQIIVNEQPILEMQDQWFICEENTLEIIADSGYDEYLWSTGETSQSIIVATTGAYEITATNIYGNLSCSTTKTVSVSNSNSATITGIETVDWTQNDNSITVFVEGDGDYEYSLDGLLYQDSNEFTNLSVDEYTIYVRDKNGCGIVTESVYLLYYPKFFTPNNDGYNDTWQIINSIREPNNKIYIFDRYGKLVKQLRPTDIGWGGTYNGSVLPSNDYWFILERQNGKTYRGHFSLKR
ncbi:T9SS type B sorting domain-containing protein [Winogradskyella litoriviva]|uniref:T9SS type B sorting domain-containing protein n=1 Tax=Winogradskyella litoriviva TaxID=1220182 RepID=A0ABX2E2J9_9FLAO|nr:T9SS type B sorting domain-containing protein [Winogradskyella litoriviva]NRD22715.1 T9SS type B sorting domain-containing protein [Winogradskyella litoriviva]